MKISPKLLAIAEQKTVHKKKIQKKRKRLPNPFTVSRLRSLLPAGVRVSRKAMDSIMRAQGLDPRELIIKADGIRKMFNKNTLLETHVETALKFNITANQDYMCCQ